MYYVPILGIRRIDQGTLMSRWADSPRLVVGWFSVAISFSVEEDLRLLRQSGIRNATSFWQEYYEAVIGGFKSDKVTAGQSPTRRVVRTVRKKP